MASLWDKIRRNKIVKDNKPKLTKVLDERGNEVEKFIKPPESHETNPNNTPQSSAIPGGIPSNTPLGNELNNQATERARRDALDAATETRSKEEREVDPENKIYNPDKALDTYLENSNNLENINSFDDLQTEEQKKNQAIVEQSMEDSRNMQEEINKKRLDELAKDPSGASLEENTNSIKENVEDEYKSPTDEVTPEESAQQEAEEEEIVTNANPENKAEAKKVSRSIWNAWRNGEISKDERNYYIMDAFAKFAKDAGKDIRNVGAAYTGGAIDNSTNTSAWDERNAALNENAALAAAESQGGPAARKAKSEELNNAILQAKAEVAPEQMKEIINSMKNNNLLSEEALKTAKGRNAAIDYINSSKLPEGMKAAALAAITHSDGGLVGGLGGTLAGLLLK